MRSHGYVLLVVAAACGFVVSAGCGAGAEQKVTETPEFTQCPEAIPTPDSPDPNTLVSNTFAGRFSESCVRRFVQTDFRLPHLERYERPVFKILDADLTTLDVQYEPIGKGPRLLLEIFPPDRLVFVGDRTTAKNGTQIS